MVTGAVVALAAGALLCAGCQARGEAMGLSGRASRTPGETVAAAATFAPVFPTAELWPSWVAVQLAGPRYCPHQPKASGCAWFFSTDGLEWVPPRLWATQGGGRVRPESRHLTTQWCNLSGCRVVDVYLGPPRH